MSSMKVKKRSGKTEEFNEKKVHNCAKRACKGLESTDYKQVVYNATLKLYDGIPTEAIDEALIRSARALIEQEPQYKFVAARLLLQTLYKQVFEEGVDSDAFDLQYRKSFITNLKKLAKAGIVNKELLKYDLKRLSNALKLDRDYLFPYIGLQTINDRYFYRIDGKIVEAPQTWLMRVAMGLALAEKPEERTDYAIKFYEVLSTFRYMTSTPTLFNAGGVRNQLSSCFLNTFEDSLEGIFDGLHQEAQKSKFAGGLGMDFTPFRAGNAVITSTGGKTQGSVYIWKMFNDMLVAINQSGKRRGAGCGYLETWHYDIYDFLDLKKNTGDDRRRCHDMNTANWIPDLFMRQVRADGPWYLMSPDEAPELHELWGEAFDEKYWEYVDKGKRGEMRLFKEVSAKELWKLMLKMLFETGHPWCVHGNTVLDVIHDNEKKQMTIAELVDRFSESENICVLSYDADTDSNQYQPIEAAQRTRIQEELYEIEDEEGNKLICTGAHLIFTQNRGYVRADCLVENDILKSITSNHV